jgi:CBS domain-containing protein
LPRCFDLRGITGELALVEQLRDFANQLLAQHPRFLDRLRRLSLRQPPPLGFLGRLILEHDGEHQAQLDLKRRGLVPLVDLVRFMAVQHQINETNTLSRLALLKSAQALPDDLADELAQSFEFLLNLRIHLEWQQLQTQEPTCWIANF